MTHISFKSGSQFKQLMVNNNIVTLSSDDIRFENVKGSTGDICITFAIEHPEDIFPDDTEAIEEQGFDLHYRGYVAEFVKHIGTCTGDDYDYDTVTCEDLSDLFDEYDSENSTDFRECFEDWLLDLSSEISEWLDDINIQLPGQD